jgi:hypothetical protein
MYQLYPLFLCLLPVHTLYGENFNEISLKTYITAIPLVLLFVASSIWGINSFTHNLYLAEFIFCFNFFALLYAKYVFMANFSKYKRSLFKYQIGFILGYFLACVIISVTVVNFYKILPLELVTKVLFCVSFLITLFVIMDIGAKIKAFKKTPSNILVSSENKDVPDIYHILADAHVGFAVPELSDEWFKSELEKRGFSIYKYAKSNYTQTNWSIPSMFSMDYIDNIIEGEGKNKNVYPSYKTLIKYGDNKWVDILKSNNYQLFFSITKPFNHLVRKNEIRKEFEVKLSNKIIETLFSTSIFAVRSSFFMKRDPEKYLFSLLNKFKAHCLKQIEAPKYCFTHFLAPHRPYLFDENGVRRTKAEMRDEKNYFSYQKYINKQILTLLDEVSSTMKENSVILLQSDHAHGGNLDVRHNILLAIKFPKNYNSNCIPKDITLVNLFGILCKEFFGLKHELLENKYYVCCANEIQPLEHLKNKDNYQLSRMEANNFKAQLNKLKHKYKNKRVVLYGAGVFFNALKRNYDLSVLNIIAISDSKFDKFVTPTFDEELGYNKISPLHINDLKPDIVLISALEDVNIEKYFIETLFKTPENRFKFDTLFKTTLATKIMEELM